MNIQNYTFITAANMGDVCPVFRRRFLVHKQIQQAALEITALGVYVAELNGTRVGDFVLAPGWTSYEHRLQVQTYDVTELLTEENELHVTVGKGRFRSPIPGWEDSEDKALRRRKQLHRDGKHLGSPSPHRGILHERQAEERGEADYPPYGIDMRFYLLEELLFDSFDSTDGERVETRLIDGF